MKKTTTVNLNSVVYNIDEDAYKRLEDYLDDLRSRLDRDVADEVMEDIEARVGELFSKRMNQYKTVVEMDDVESVIETLGSPESFGPATHNTAETEEGRRGEASGGYQQRHRKFYRDTDNKILGGVAAGTAVALGWDVTLVRVLFFVSLLVSFGWATLIYVLLWVIVPEARTVAQKLEMHGIEPSAQNISEWSGRYPQQENSGNPDRNQFFGTLLKATGCLVLVPILAILVFVVIIVVLALFAAFCEFGVEILPVGVTSVTAIAMVVCWAIAIIIPIVYVVWLIVKKVRKEDVDLKGKGFIIWLAIWLLALITAGCLTVYAAKNVDREDLRGIMERLDDGGDYGSYEEVSEVRCDSMPFTAINVNGPVELEVVKDTVWYVEVKAASNTIRNIWTVVKDGELEMKFPKHGFVGSEVTVHYVEAVKTMRFEGGTAADVEGFVADTLYIICRNGAALDIEDCKVGELNVEGSNGAAIDISGEAGNVNVKAKRGAAVDISDLKVSGKVAKEVDMASDVDE